jgi:hypothetical protein
VKPIKLIFMRRRVSHSVNSVENRRRELDLGSHVGAGVLMLRFLMLVCRGCTSLVAKGAWRVVERSLLAAMDLSHPPGAD